MVLSIWQTCHLFVNFPFPNQYLSNLHPFSMMQAPLYQGKPKTRCVICFQKGLLLCCDFCERVYHPHCLSPQITSQPQDYWMCPQCISKTDQRTITICFSFVEPFKAPTYEEEDESFSPDLAKSSSYSNFNKKGKFSGVENTNNRWVLDYWQFIV